MSCSAARKASRASSRAPFLSGKALHDGGVDGGLLSSRLVVNQALSRRRQPVPAWRARGGQAPARSLLLLRRRGEGASVLRSRSTRDMAGMGLQRRGRACELPYRPTPSELESAIRCAAAGGVHAPGRDRWLRRPLPPRRSDRAARGGPPALRNLPRGGGDRGGARRLLRRASVRLDALDQEQALLVPLSGRLDRRRAARKAADRHRQIGSRAARHSQDARPPTPARGGAPAQIRPKRALRCAVYFHQGAGGAPRMKSLAAMNVSSTHGSCRWPVAAQSFW